MVVLHGRVQYVSSRGVRESKKMAPRFTRTKTEARARGRPSTHEQAIESGVGLPTLNGGESPRQGNEIRLVKAADTPHPMIGRDKGVLPPRLGEY